MNKKFIIPAFIFLFSFFGATCTFAQDKKVLKTEEKEAQIIDETRMQEPDIKKVSIKEMKQKEKEAQKLEEIQRKQRKLEIKQQEKNAKIQEKMDKIQAKAEAKKAKLQEKENKKLEKISKKQAKKDPLAQSSQSSQDKKETLASEEPLKNQDIKEVDQQKVLKEENIKEVSDNKKEAEIEEKTTSKTQTDKEAVDLENTKEDKQTQKEVKTEEAREEEPQNETTTMPELQKKDFTFEDIDKNAVSINDFLKFTDKQNERFSVYYYKTTSKINNYTKQIQIREKLIKEVKKQNLGNKERYEKLKKLEQELDILMRERDSYYNKSLEKFKGMLNKKQVVKWEILQQMGYRFLPEYD